LTAGYEYRVQLSVVASGGAHAGAVLSDQVLSIGQ